MKLLSAILGGIMAISAVSATAEKDTRKEVKVTVNAVSYTILVNSDGKTAELKSVILPISYARAEVPETVSNYAITAIGEKAYAGNFNVEEITIGKNIKKMGQKAFMSCNELKTVTINEGITAIPDDCFFACPKLTTVKLPATLKTIGNDAFFGCVGLDMEIPSTVTEIGENAIGMEAETHDGGTVAVKGFLIKGTKGSAVEKYAKENGIDFIDMKNYLSGDSNGDDVVDSSDASAVLGEYSLISTGSLATFTKKQHIMCDVNGDGILDSSDASEILEIYAEISTKG